MQEGTVLRNNYRLDRLLGRGGMAEVYLAFDMRRQVHVAIKILREDLAEDPEFVRRFTREAEALARLDHPHIVRFYSFERQGAVAFIVMDFVPGTTLQRHLAELGGPLPLGEVSTILHQVGAALQYAHSEGYIHRDIKPGNIMLRDDGNALLSDFGIARAAESATLMTATMGTPAYMAPEQILGRELDRRTDIYSFGIVLFEMLTGRRPFTGDERGITGTGTLARLREAHLRVQAPDPRSLNPALPPGLGDVVLRALAKDPAQRWPDVVSLIQAWDAVAPVAGLTPGISGRAAPGTLPTVPARSTPPAADPRLASSKIPVTGGMIAPAATPLSAWAATPAPSASPARGGGVAEDLRQSRPGPGVGQAAPEPRKTKIPVTASPAVTGRPPLALSKIPVTGLAVAAALGVIVIAILVWRLVASGSAAPKPTVSAERTTQAQETTLAGAIAVAATATTSPAAAGAPSPGADLRQPTSTLVSGSGTLVQAALTSTPTAMAAATATPQPRPVAVVGQDEVNAREGPGTSYPIAGQFAKGQRLDIVAMNPAKDWWQVCCLKDQQVWIAGSLVQTEGNTSAVQVATNIPTPPPAPPAECQPWHKKPRAGYGILLVENHIGDTLYLEWVVGGTGKWTLAAKKGDVPGRWWQELPAGHHEFRDALPSGEGRIILDVEAGKSYISPVWFNDREKELIYPMEIPAGCQ